MSVPPNALDSLVELVAEKVATRVLDSLVELQPPAAAVEEAWRLLTLEEAAARLGRSTRWTRERVKRGDLPFVKLDGGSLRFEIADLQAFAQSRRVSADRVQTGREPARNGRSRQAEAVGNRRVSGS